MHLNSIKNKAIFLFGATASGKTKLALQIADHFPVHLINVDASQVYRKMDIGTAKLSKELLQKYPHALIDICDPSQVYSSGEFRRDALLEMQKATQENKIPLLVGGTMLYFKQLLNNADNLPPADLEFRQKMQQRIDREGGDFLYQDLCAIDKTTAENIGAKNLQRLVRALELFHLTGKTPQQIWAEQKQNADSEFSDWDFLQLGLMPEDRKILHKNIEIRWQEMLDLGLIAEVEALKNRGDLSLELPSMRAVGYRQVWEYLDGNLDFQQMNEKALAATRQLAKRQITWLRSWDNAQIYVSESNNLFAQIKPQITAFLSA